MTNINIQYPMTNIPHPEDDYPALFRQHVRRSVQAVLVRARRESTPGLNEAGRTRIFAVLDYALRLADAWPTVRELLRVLSPQFNLGGYWGQWLPYLERGIALGEKYQDQAIIAALSCDLGLLYQRLGKLDIAETYLAHACTVARAAQETAILGSALQQWAEVERLRRRYAECTTLLAEAQALFAETNPTQAHGLFIAGKAALDQHDLTAATSAFTEAIRLWQVEDNQGRIAVCIQNLGRIAVERGEPLTAIPLYKQAIDLLNKIGDLSSLAVVRMNLGVAYYLVKQFDQAQTLYCEAETSFLRMNDNRSLAMVYNNLGLIYTAWSEWHEAKAHLQRGIELHKQLGDEKARINTKGNLGIFYLEQGDYAYAIKVFQEALNELKSTARDAEYERLYHELTKYLKQSQERGQLA